MWYHYSSLAVAQHHDRQRREIQPHEYPLPCLNVFSLVCEVVQERVDVDVASRVNERSCSSFDECVVAFAGLVLRDLFHVGFPVDLGVWEALSVVDGEDGLCGSYTGSCRVWRRRGRHRGL